MQYPSNYISIVGKKNFTVNFMMDFHGLFDSLVHLSFSVVKFLSVHKDLDNTRNNSQLKSWNGFRLFFKFAKMLSYYNYIFIVRGI